MVRYFDTLWGSLVKHVHVDVFKCRPVGEIIFITQSPSDITVAVTAVGQDNHDAVVFLNHLR